MYLQRHSQPRIRSLKHPRPQQQHANELQQGAERDHDRRVPVRIRMVAEERQNRRDAECHEIRLAQIARVFYYQLRKRFIAPPNGAHARRGVEIELLGDAVRNKDVTRRLKRSTQPPPKNGISFAKPGNKKPSRIGRTPPTWLGGWANVTPNVTEQKSPP